MASKKVAPRPAPAKSPAKAHAKPVAKPAAKPAPIRPGEIIVAAGDIELNAGRAAITLDVANTGDRPIQVGSHYHFFETNAALRFDRARARGCRLDIPAGTAVRFEPGQTRTIALIPYAGDRVVHGFQGKIEGAL